MNISCSLDRFEKDTADHRMEVVLDQGVHRHLRFRRPGTNCYAFDIVTWPGHLAVSGDVGSSVFTRLHDMFDFFRSSPTADGKLRINASYWSEKLVANDGDARRYSAEAFQAALKSAFDSHFDNRDLNAAEQSERELLWEHIERESEFFDNGFSALAWADEFKPEEWRFPLLHGFRFRDFWEHTITEFDFRLVWRLYAVAYGVRTYDQLKVPA